MNMNSAKTKIDAGWDELFEKYNILSHVNDKGSFRITSKQINDVHQARLMAKFDKSTLLPQIFRDNKLSILPITTGDYLIGPFVTHEKICYPDVEPMRVGKTQLETIDAENIHSEAAALLFAYNSGIISDVIGSKPDEVKFTVYGRMRTESFSYNVKNSLVPEKLINIDVNGSQIEIDAGFESHDAFFICEAKNQASEEMLIRQLYYPYRLWNKKITKSVVPMFLAYSNKAFHIFIYEFEDEQNYNSIKLKNYKKYITVDNEDISLQELIELWHSITVGKEPNISFPQADSFYRVFDLLTILYKGELTRTEVTLEFEFDSRQTNYYVSACEYLGLVERFTAIGGERGYRLTLEAQKIMALPSKKIFLTLIKKILEKPVFYKAFQFFTDNHVLPDKNIICQIMNEMDFPIPINNTTIERRSSTVYGWLKWMIDITVTE